MGIFSSIKDFIFGKHADQSAAPQPHAAPVGASPSPVAPVATPATASIVMDKVDVAAILDRQAAASGHQYNWRQSIVDLMKLCGMDASLDHRKELAHELGYTGDTNDTLAMNLWLHTAVMRKLEESGGKVPEELRR